MKTEDMELVKDLGGLNEKEAPTKEELTKRWTEIDEQLHILRTLEQEQKEQLREALDNLSSTQKGIEGLEDDLTEVCLTLQELNK